MECEGGTIFIKHQDRWKGWYYLSDDLTFVSSKKQACKFRFSKSETTSIINGDRISITSDRGTLCVSDSLTPIFSKPGNVKCGSDTFLITNGTNDTKPITFGEKIHLLHKQRGKEEIRILNFYWPVELVDPESEAQPTLMNCRPKKHPVLTLDEIWELPDREKPGFVLERASGTMTKIPKEAQLRYQDKGKRTAIIIALLMMVLALCVMVERV